MVQSRGTVKIRKMVDADLPRVNEIDRLLSGARRVSTWPFSFESYWSVYRPQLSFVAEVGGKVAGFIVGTVAQEEHSRSVLNLRHGQDLPVQRQHRQDGWVDMIGVDPAYQGMGACRALVQAFRDECLRIDAGMRALATESDKTLRGFFEGAGLKTSGLVLYESD